MDQQSTKALQQFKSHIAIPFQLYNSLFTSLPFHAMEKTGTLLSLFSDNCAEGYDQNLSPVEIIESFFEKHTSYQTTEEKHDLLFRFIQYVERQVVLFDSLEDAAFKKVNDMNGPGTFKHLESEVVQKRMSAALAEKLKDFCVRIVLTAHPTQFYPGPVLGIIHDLSLALKRNETDKINMYLQQLGKTAFLNKTKPTPYDEAVSLIWFLEHVFYAATGKMMSFLKNSFPAVIPPSNPAIALGFWPGGDRDGNPNVNTAITLKVAEALKLAIIKCYYRDVKKIRRRLTFKGLEQLLADTESILYRNIFATGEQTSVNSKLLLDNLEEVKQIVKTKHDGLFETLVDDLINKVQVFGVHFASLDIRQESSIHNQVLEAIAAKEELLPKNYASLSAENKINALTGTNGRSDRNLYEGMIQDTLYSMEAIKLIQKKNGEAGCHRYIISQCNSALNIMEVFGLLLLGGWQKESLTVDIVPLFETVEDLKQAGGIMEMIFSNEVYRNHISRRNNTQTIMVGFSDGTKDGGYLAANWSIYNAKKELTSIGKKYDVEIIFFDGRGGPPARGGGKTHKFYAAMGKSVSNKQIQLTIQGQTISSGFGTKNAAQFNMEQLMTAGISNDLFPADGRSLTENEIVLLKDVSAISLEKYLNLRNHPKLIDYLATVSPIKYYSDTNIGSRPANRKAGNDFKLKDLRAIPFVGAWAQLKQNVTGYYGVGTALEKIHRQGRWGEIETLYKKSLFVKTLMDNCEMSMKKCFFPLTAVLSSDKEFSGIWNDIHDEFELSKKYLLMLSGKEELMVDYPVEQLSIGMRDKIVLPILTIQQYALAKLRLDDVAANEQLKSVFEKMLIRCSFGIINAGRNSA